MTEADNQFESGFLRLKNNYMRMLSDYRESNELLAEDFNIFSLVGVGHYEVTTHSAILRELLDSQGSHGQGNLFFIEFLSMLAEKKSYHEMTSINTHLLCSITMHVMLKGQLLQGE